jgi:hypothetical protein
MPDRRSAKRRTCYSNTTTVLFMLGMFAGPMSRMAIVDGHGGVGVVEAVGPSAARASR